VFFTDLGAQDRDPARDVDALRAELKAFDPELAARPSLVVATKVDVARDVLETLPDDLDALPISAVTGEGIDDLLRLLAERVAKARATAPERIGYVRHVVRDEPTRVARENGAWRVTGKAPERAVVTTDLDNEEAVGRLQRKLVQMGVERMLEQAGAKEGDEVRIGEVAFDFQPEKKAAGGETSA
jgi:GTP-binding protein